MRVFIRKYYTLIKFNPIKPEPQYEFILPILQYIPTTYYSSSYCEPIYNC